MKCYRCGVEELHLAALTPYERREYPRLGIIMRICHFCGLEQNHMGDDEVMRPEYAARNAPIKKIGA